VFYIFNFYFFHFIPKTGRLSSDFFPLFSPHLSPWNRPKIRVANTCALREIKWVRIFLKAVGQWRSMSIFFIFMPFAIEKRNSFFALSSKIKLPIGLTNSGADQTRPSNAPICLRPEQESRPNRKNFASPLPNCLPRITLMAK
jgi:hypothetical protein